MIARIQQTVAFFILTSLAAWIWYVLPDYSRIHIGFLLVVASYASFLAIEFIVICILNRHEPQPRATFTTLLAAWWRETTTAPKLFLWRQPFRTFAQPDQRTPSNERGVVFIHGFVCNRAFWAPWMVQLRQQNRAFAAVSLEPIFGSIDSYSSIIETAVAHVTQATGQAPVLVCHSMGGLAARAWLRADAANEARVHRIITLGTPHFGTVLSINKSLLPFTNTQQMQRFSAWTQQLAKDEPATRYAKFTCFYSNCDNIVVPTSTAMLPGADNRLVTAQGHVSMAFDEQVVRDSLRLLL
jgi:triacylglycerol lipase